MSPTRPPKAKLAAAASAEPSAPNGRRMLRGRWQDPAEAQREPRADKTLSVRLTEAELAELDAQIDGLGLTRNRALRIAARRIGGFLEVDGATVAALREINRQLAGVATNVNQIAHAANRTHDPDYRAFLAQRAELGRLLLETRGVLQRILDLGARREDGLARLAEAVSREVGRGASAGGEGAPDGRKDAKTERRVAEDGVPVRPDDVETGCRDDGVTE